MVHEGLIDLHNLQIFLDFKYRWHVNYYENIDGYYVEATKYIGTFDGKPKRETIFLHKYLTGAGKGVVVDHKNRNTKDNREENFRITSNDKNLKNRKSKNSNNKSGYRNVCWIDGKWWVQLQIEGKNTKLKSFDDVHEAGKYAEEKRKEIYGEFAGRS